MRATAGLLPRSDRRSLPHPIQLRSKPTRRWSVIGCFVMCTLVVACGSEASTTSPTDTIATSDPTSTTEPATTAVASTSAPSTTEPEPTTAPTVPVSAFPTVDFDPACTEREPSRVVPKLDETAFDRFGPIGPEPSIEIVMPSASLGGGSQPQPGVRAMRIPGGMLLDFEADANATSAGMLTAIDHDGRVRWQRCVDEGVWRMIAADASLDPTSALVGIGLFADGSSAWKVLSLADGRVTGALADLDAPSGWTREDLASSGIVGVGHRVAAISPEATTDDVERIAFIDLVTMTVSAMPEPPDTGVGIGPFYEFAADDRLVQLGYSPGAQHPVPTAVLVDGEWSTEPDDLAAARPLLIGYHFDDLPEGDAPYLEAFDASGRTVWERPDLATLQSEGFHDVTVGDVVIAVTCPATAADFTCTGYRTGGYERATGRTIWERDGYGAVAVSGDGYALALMEPDAAGNAAWGLIDVQTGEQVQADQRWDELSTFATECCGGDVFQRAEGHGAIVLTVSDNTVRIYQPQAMARPTVHVEVS
jgi:hypothetical protein